MKTMKIAGGILGIILFMCSLIVFLGECDDLGFLLVSKIASLLTGYVGYRMTDWGMGDEIAKYDDEA